jgi:hypothetical protein
VFSSSFFSPRKKTRKYIKPVDLKDIQSTLLIRTIWMGRASGRGEGGTESRATGVCDCVYRGLLRQAEV